MSREYPIRLGVSAVMLSGNAINSTTLTAPVTAILSMSSTERYFPLFPTVSAFSNVTLLFLSLDPEIQYALRVESNTTAVPIKFNPATLYYL